MPDTPPVHHQDEAGYRAIIRTRVRDWDRRVHPLHVFGGRPLLDPELPVSSLTARAIPLGLDLDLSDPRLAALGIQGLRRLAILAPFGMEPDPDASLVIRHLDGGQRLELVTDLTGRLTHDVPELPQLPVELEAISEAEAAVDSVDEMPEGGLDLHQVGGRPLWIGKPIEPPRCPVTGEPMRFIASLASIRRFPLAHDDMALSFGNEGMLYVYWSQSAAMTVALVQGR